MTRESYLKKISDVLTKQAEVLEKMANLLEQIVNLWLEAAGKKPKTEEKKEAEEVE